MAQTEDLLVELRTMQSDERLPAEVRDRVRQIAGRIEQDLESLYARIRELDELVVELSSDAAELQGADVEPNEDGICSQCGKPYSHRACGPSHALIAKEMHDYIP